MKIGVLGAGQLASMLAMAAKKLDLTLVCVDTKEPCPASQYTETYCVDLNNTTKLAEIFHGVDCITYETENLPIAPVKALGQHFNIAPSIQALALFQDRLLEKSFIASLAIPVVNYVDLTSWEIAQETAEKLSYPFIIKTRCNGYDGKGQEMIRNFEDLTSAWAKFTSTKTIAEQFLTFDFEVSIIAARGKNKEIVFYPLTLNRHKNGILQSSEAPFMNAELENQAQQYASLLMEKLDYVGVMAIEFFCVQNKLVVNEIAPRVHNSGHWTIEGATTSQFENHLRAIAGLELGSTATTGHSLMFNIIGHEPDRTALTALPDAHFHWYGKEVRPGRKLGHVTLCAATAEILHQRAGTYRDLMNVKE